METAFYFASKMSIRVLNEFIGYLPEVESESGFKLNIVEGSIIILVRLDALIGTAVTCLRTDRMDKTEDRRQKPSHDTFASFLLKAFERVVGTVRVSTKLWCFTELLMSLLSIKNGC